MKQYSFLCRCNNCGIILIDRNPQIGAKKHILNGSEKNMIEIKDGLYYLYACPNCHTDGYLIDL